LADGAIGVNRFTFSTTRPITLPDGTPVSFGMLLSGGLVHAINEQANGTAVPGSVVCVWTGFDAAGTPTPHNCVNGSSTSNQRVGAIGDYRQTNTQWADSVDVICSDTCLLYCLGL